MKTLDLRPAVKNDYDMPPEAIEAFTCGDCWALAIAIAREAALPIVTCSVPGEPDEWCHVAVQTPDGKILDIQGVWEPAAWLAFWSPALGGNAEVATWDRTQFEAHTVEWNMLLQWDEIVSDFSEKVLDAYTSKV